MSYDTSREALILSCRPLAFKLAKAFHRRNPWLELADVLSEAMVGLCRAADTFDPRRSAFTTWTSRIVGQHLVQTVRRKEVRAGELTTDPTAPASVDHLADVESVAVLKRHLMPRDFAILWAVHGEGQTLEAVGRDHGIKRQRVFQLLTRAKEWAREVIA